MEFYLKKRRDFASQGKQLAPHRPTARKIQQYSSAEKSNVCHVYFLFCRIFSYNPIKIFMLLTVKIEILFWETISFHTIKNVGTA